jgi:hypothetical protein
MSGVMGASAAGYPAESAVAVLVCIVGLFVAVWRFRQTLPNLTRKPAKSEPLIIPNQDDELERSKSKQTQKELAICTMVSCVIGIVLAVDFRHSFSFTSVEVHVFLILLLSVPLAIASLLWVKHLNERIAEYKDTKTIAMKQPKITTKEETFELTRTISISSVEDVRASTFIMGKTTDAAKLFSEIQRPQTIFDHVVEKRNLYQSRNLIPILIFVYCCLAIVTFALIAATGLLQYAGIILVFIAALCLAISFDCFALFVILKQESDRMRHAVLDRVLSNYPSGFSHVAERNREKEKSHRMILLRCLLSSLSALFSSGFASYGAAQVFLHSNVTVAQAMMVDTNDYTFNAPHFIGIVYFAVLTFRHLSVS